MVRPRLIDVAREVGLHTAEWMIYRIYFEKHEDAAAFAQACRDRGVKVTNPHYSCDNIDKHWYIHEEQVMG